jgi:hypothetical protein
MRYEEIRSSICDGDLVAVRETHGFLTPFTRFFTRSPITHVGVALWMDGGLWMAELNGGKNHLVPLSQLSETDFDVYASPVADQARIRAAVSEALRVKVSYGTAALLVIGLLDWLKIRVFLHARRVLVCSGYCVSIYEAAGWPEHSRVVSPRELASLLVQKFPESERAIA